MLFRSIGQAGFEGGQGAQGQSPSESWSSATAVPATLNVEDWYDLLFPFLLSDICFLGGKFHADELIAGSNSSASTAI